MSLAHKPLTRAAFLTSFALASLASPSAATWCGNPVPPCDPTNPNSRCYQPPPPDPRCEPRECKKCTKSPCYVGSGVYVNSAVDLELPTPGFTLSASRLYESTHTIDGPMGHGWTSSLTAHLYHATYLLAAPNIVEREANITMPDGARYRFVEDGVGGFTPPLGRHDNLVHNPDGSFDLTIQRTMSKLHFAADGALISMTDDFGNSLLLTYDGAGHLERIADQAGTGRYIDVYWGADGRISDLVDSAARGITFTYDAHGLLTTATDPLDRETQFSYAPGKYVPLLASVTDHWGRPVSAIAFDSKDRVTSYSDKGETFTYMYSYQGNPFRTAKVDGAGNTWVFAYSSGGLVIDQIPPAGASYASRHTDFYPDGAIQLVVDELGSKTHLTYDSFGNVATLTRYYQTPHAIRYDYEYDPAFSGRVTSITPRNPTSGMVDPSWQAWRFSYHQTGSAAPGALNQVLRVRSDGVTLEALATLESDTKGRLVSYTDAAGGTTDFVFDAEQNQTAVIRPANNVSGIRPETTFTYDALGRVTAKTDAEDNLTTFEHDAVGRIQNITLPPLGIVSPIQFAKSFTYDEFDSGSGLIFSTEIDSSGATTRRGRDQFDRTRITVDPLGATSLRTFTQGLLNSSTDAMGNVTSYSYDKLRRLVSITFPDLAIESYTYFADGSLKSRLDRKSQLTNYEYDLPAA
jgi:YD repeat-containing protein